MRLLKLAGVFGQFEGSGSGLKPSNQAANASKSLGLVSGSLLFDCVQSSRTFWSSSSSRSSFSTASAALIQSLSDTLSFSIGELNVQM